MVRNSLSAVGLAALLVPYCAADLYARNSPVLSLNEKAYFSHIAASNHTSIVEFYAPWCGHCKNLQPAYEKAAKSLAGLAKVAAVNCDEEHNKPFCGSMGVQGFPTLKIVKPGKKTGKPFVEDYQGPRTAKDIVGAVKDKISNHVKRLQDTTIDAWLEADKDKPKAILFTDKGTTSALLKAVAIDFLGGISVGQVRNKEKASCDKYGVTSFPTLVLIPGGDAEAITFKGKFEKPMMVNFLSQAATPNPDPAPKKAKTKASSTKKAKAAADSSKLSKASAAHRSADSESAKASQTSETVLSPEDSPGPIASPDAQKPIDLHQAENNLDLIAPLFNDDAVQKACLTRKSGTCVLLFSPQDGSQDETIESMLAMGALTKIYNRLAARGKTFKFYNVVNAPDVRKQLKLANGLAVVAVNAKKGWLKRFVAEQGTDAQSLENWIDALRMGEGAKESLAAGVVVEATADDASSEASGAATTAPAEPAAQQSPDPADRKAEPTLAAAQQEEQFESVVADIASESAAAGAGHDEL